MEAADHINVYSRSASPLGRMLSNFAHTPFELHGIRFESVEGWWYWRKTGVLDCASKYGLEAKRFGQMQRVVNTSDPTREELREVYLAKARANPGLQRLLLESTLPFDHYYEYNGKRVDTKHRWTGQLWNDIREELKR